MLRVLLLALVIGCSSSKPAKVSRDTSGRSGLHLVYSFDLESVTPESRREVQEQAITTIGNRLRALGTRNVAVGPLGEGIEVVLPQLPEEELRRLRKLLERPATLAFRMVEEAAVDGVARNDFMNRLYATSREDPEALALGITADIDQWQHAETGRRYTDYWLRADDRKQLLSSTEADAIGCVATSDEESSPTRYCQVSGRHSLMKYLVGVGMRDPEVRLDQKHSFGFERVSTQRGIESYWRTYYLNNEVSLSGKDVEKAYVETNRYTNRPEVFVEFTRKGKARFSELTGRNLGRKLAISLDNTINSAPTIQSRIDGGTCVISMGDIDAAQMHSEAEELASVLNAGALPATIHLDSQTLVP